MYGDGVKLACTPEDLDNAGEVLYFKNYVNDLERVYYAREYKIKWENTEDRMCAQIEELFFDYSGKNKLTF